MKDIKNVFVVVFVVCMMSADAAFANTLSGGDTANLFQMCQQQQQNRLTALSDLRKLQCKQSNFEKQREDAENRKTIPPQNDVGNCAGNDTGGTTCNRVQAAIEKGQVEAQEPVEASATPTKIADPIYINKGVPDGPPVAPIYFQGAGPTVVNIATKSMSNGDIKAIQNAMLKQPKVVPMTGVEGWVRTAMTAAYKSDMQHSLPRQVHNAEVQQQTQVRGAAEAAADGAEATEASAIDELWKGLINVANENAAVPGSPQQATKILPQAIWMVQQMYHQCYIPIAVLLLLPGAVMTQMKALIQHGMLSGAPEDEEMQGPSPFVGIFRSIIAIFLIPATQLLISWMIEIGNSMTYEVEKYIVVDDVFNWAKEQTYNPPTKNDENVLSRQPDDVAPTDPASNPTDPDQGTGIKPGINGPATNGTEAHSAVRDTSLGNLAIEAGYNMVSFALAAAFGVLLAFQTVMMCYLMLLGPIAAAFYAWPSGVGSLFKKVFVNWVDAVINLSLWRFWWVVVILIMYVRITALKAMGQYEPNNQWEMAMYTAFMVIICYVPFMPFEFNPSEMVQKVLDKAEQSQQSGSGGGGGGGGSGGRQNSTGAGVNSSSGQLANATALTSRPGGKGSSRSCATPSVDSAPPRAGFCAPPNKNNDDHDAPPHSPPPRHVIV